MATSALQVLAVLLLIAPAGGLQVRNSLSSSQQRDMAQKRLEKRMSELATALRGELGHTEAVNASQLPMLASKARDLLKRRADQLNGDDASDLIGAYANFAPDIVLVIPSADEDEGEMPHEEVDADSTSPNDSKWPWRPWGPHRPWRPWGPWRPHRPLWPHRPWDSKDSPSQTSSSDSVTEPGSLNSAMQGGSLNSAMQGLSSEMYALSSVLGPSLTRNILGSIFNEVLDGTLPIDNHDKPNDASIASGVSHQDEQSSKDSMIDEAFDAAGLADKILNSMFKTTEDSEGHNDSRWPWRPWGPHRPWSPRPWGPWRPHRPWWPHRPWDGKNSTSQTSPSEPGQDEPDVVIVVPPVNEVKEEMPHEKLDDDSTSPNDSKWPWRPWGPHRPWRPWGPWRPHRPLWPHRPWDGKDSPSQTSSSEPVEDEPDVVIVVPPVNEVKEEMPHKKLDDDSTQSPSSDPAKQMLPRTVSSASTSSTMSEETRIENGKRVTTKRICENGHCKTVETTEDLVA